MNQQLNFVDFHIAQTISNDDPIKQTFSAIDWQLVAKLAPKRSKKGRKSYDFVSMKSDAPHPLRGGKRD